MISACLHILSAGQVVRKNWKKSLFCLNSSRRFWGIAEATIEDFAFEARPLREVDEVSRPRCLSTRQEKRSESRYEKESISWGWVCRKPWARLSGHGFSPWGRGERSLYPSGISSLGKSRVFSNQLSRSFSEGERGYPLKPPMAWLFLTLLLMYYYFFAGVMEKRIEKDEDLPRTLSGE